ncbi:MAG TPA: hypothetical protein VNZ26_33380 [Vicinamibacterales bacterium]|jgi:hypothetical protein|nr:hypothetical protein [Vicinamibacterales bacterium]
MTRTWPDDWEARKRGDSCFFFGNLSVQSFHSGRVSEAVLERNAFSVWAISYIVGYFTVVQMAELLTFVETNVFTKRISAFGLEGSLRGLQLELLDNPEAGDVEPGTAGLRKIRQGDPTRGKGKRGGARVHYL